jgi:hypothetical protein
VCMCRHVSVLCTCETPIVGGTDVELLLLYSRSSSFCCCCHCGHQLLVLRLLIVCSNIAEVV